LRPTGETSFLGTGQGRSPRHWQEEVLAGRTPWFHRAPDEPDEVARLGQALNELPDQDRPRPDPVYRLISLTTR
jgi:hypothetical protein